MLAFSFNINRPNFVNTDTCFQVSRISIAASRYKLIEESGIENILEEKSNTRKPMLNQYRQEVKALAISR